MELFLHIRQQDAGLSCKRYRKSRKEDVGGDRNGGKDDSPAAGVINRPEGYQKNEENPLDGDVLILDECSMIDIILMYNLFESNAGTNDTDSGRGY